MGAPVPASKVVAVALLTPTGRDGDIARRVLAKAGFEARICADMEAIRDAIHGEIGAVLVAEEALGPADRTMLLAALDAQPSWSDVPVIILTGEGQLGESPRVGLEPIALRGNVTLLERPVRVATLVTTLRSALRARGRQLEVRRYLEERRIAEETLRENESRLRAAREQAEHANRAKSEFLTMMSHELRTPLNAISGYTQILALGVRGPVTPEQREDLARIDKSQRHLLSLINDILNFAKIEAGHLAVDVRPVRLRHVLQYVEPLVAPQLRAKSIRYEDGSRGCDCVALADEEKTRQIVLNLLSNAIKFTPPGGTIAISCAADERMARITVTDSGIGIAAEKLGAIFEPFVQVERHYASTHEGTGLGLSISRNLARRMGGDLTVASELGGGAKFTLALPAASADGSPGRSRVSEAAPSAGASLG